MGLKNKQLPFVSVCTPTFNRRPFIETMFNCFRNQTYPKNRIEWIIVDDGTDKIKDLIESSDIPQIRYFEVDSKMTLGAKRNYMHKFVRGSIIVYMDDDDYYPPERIEDAVDKLEANPNALAAGSSEIYIYFKHIQKMYKCGPYNPNHATAGTFAFRTELLKHTKYEEGAAVAEERAFLKDYTIPFVQLDPMKAILVFSHNHNTFDKRKMLDNPHPDFFRECDKTVEMFIRNPDEKNIYNFFMKDIDALLEKYEPGEAKMKPDVLKQIKEIEEKRDQMIKEEVDKQHSAAQIMLQQPGKPPIALNNQQIVDMVHQQQKQIQFLVSKCEESENIISSLQTQLVEKTKMVQELSAGIMPEFKEIASVELQETNANLEGMVVSLQKQVIAKTKENRELAKSASTDDEIKKVVTMLQKQLIEKTKTIRELTSADNTTELKNMISMLQEQSLEKTRTIRELTSADNSTELKNMVSMLQEQSLEKTRSIDELNISIESLKLENLQYYSKNNETEMKLDNKVRQLDGIITMLQSQLTDKNMEAIESSQKYTDFSKKHSEISQRYSELSQRYMEVNQKYAESNMKIAELSQEIVTIREIKGRSDFTVVEDPSVSPPIIEVFSEGRSTEENLDSEKNSPVEAEFTRIPIQMVRGQSPQQLTTENTVGGDHMSLTKCVNSSLEESGEKGKCDPEFCVDAED